MVDLPSLSLNLAVALGIVLLTGAERERRKGEGSARAPAGIRTFSVVSLVGATSVTLVLHGIHRALHYRAALAPPGERH
jgi:uncharacterized membrane protein YhiD involved in acid resistance